MSGDAGSMKLYGSRVSLCLTVTGILILATTVPTLAHDYISGPVPDSLRTAVRSDDWQIRAKAYAQLKYYTEEDVFKLLGEGLNDPHPRVILAALGDLTHCKSRYYDRYLELIARDDPLIREYAAIALGRSGSPLRVEPLIGLLNDPAPKVRVYAMQALGWIKDERAREPLALAMEHEKGDLNRLHAALALAQFGDMRALPVLIERTQPEIAVGLRVQATRSLKILDCLDSHQKLLELLHDENIRVRTEAATAAGELGMTEAVPRLREMLADSPERPRGIREAYREALEHITGEPYER